MAQVTMYVILLVLVGNTLNASAAPLFIPPFSVGTITDFVRAGTGDKDGVISLVKRVQHLRTRRGLKLVKMGQKARFAGAAIAGATMACAFLNCKKSKDKKPQEEQ